MRQNRRMACIEITEEWLRDQVGDGVFEQALACTDKVAGLSAVGALIEANMDGAQVSVRVLQQGLDVRCECPASGACLHGVAVALAWVRTGEDEPQADLFEVLRRQDRDWLARWLSELAEGDADLAARLLDAAEDADDVEAAEEVADLRAEFDEVLRELADEASNYSDEWYPDTGQLDALLDDAEQLADDAPDAVRELADLLIERIERILDFGNCYGDLTGALERAQDLHLDASLAGSPDPVLLAERLIRGALDSGWGSFDTAFPDYADLLGTAGVARYRELLAQASARGDKISDYTLRRLHESLARAEGGTDAVVAMLAQQAGAAHDYVRIAELLIADGRDDDALAWIARGMEVFPDSVQLPSLALDCHQRAGRRDEILQMLWRLFTAAPSIGAYLKLKLEAGTETVGWADRAIGHLRDRRPLPSAVLAEILLAEGNVAAAWDVVNRDAVAVGFGLRMRVVEQRAETHPADAIRFYQELATARAACSGSRAAYLEAVKYLRMAAELSDRSSAQDEFTVFMADLRAAHPGKKLLQQELTAAGLP